MFLLQRRFPTLLFGLWLRLRLVFWLFHKQFLARLHGNMIYHDWHINDPYGVDWRAVRDAYANVGYLDCLQSAIEGLTLASLWTYCVRLLQCAGGQAPHSPERAQRSIRLAKTTGCRSWLGPVIIVE